MENIIIYDPTVCYTTKKHFPDKKVFPFSVKAEEIEIV